jgi:hypothetical protein
LLQSAYRQNPYRCGVLDELVHTNLDGSRDRFGIETPRHAIRVEADDKHLEFERLRSHYYPIFGSLAYGGCISRSLLA